MIAVDYDIILKNLPNENAVVAQLVEQLHGKE